MDTRDVLPSDSHPLDDNDEESDGNGAHDGGEAQSPTDSPTINPLTPPRPCMTQGAFNFISDSCEEVDTTNYYSDAKSEDEGKGTQNT